MAGYRALVRLLMAAVLAAVVGTAFAADAPRTPVPKPPKAAKGTECVEPVADMRRNHMVYLDHERDETVHKGIRGRKHSLKGCVECHAVPAAAVGGARTVGPFCAECHRYAAVTIDCFGCHATTPETQAASAPARKSP
ncbi:MAG: Hdr-like menaquinol oxidoreductase cytochrome c subunit [Rhodospirillales bacterium]|nr:Hdr-like menaquinol oxidoreductase cytochrome c subunit [Rhodospirillales bacterium]